MTLSPEARRQLALDLCARLVSKYVEHCNVRTFKRSNFQTFKRLNSIGESAFHAAEVEHAAHQHGQSLADTFTFGRLPAGCAQRIGALYQARDAEAVPALADALVASFGELLAGEGVDVHDYSAVAEIPV